MASMSNGSGKPVAQPLTKAESEKLWRYERALVRAGAMAVLLLAVGLGAAQLFGEAAWVRIAVIAGAAALIVGALALQMGERCPRCGTRVARLTPPERCQSCGVAFPRPEHLDSELDN